MKGNWDSSRRRGCRSVGLSIYRKRSTLQRSGRRWPAANRGLPIHVSRPHGGEHDEDNQRRPHALGRYLRRALAWLGYALMIERQAPAVPVDDDQAVHAAV